MLFLTNLNLNKNEIQNAVMQPLATAPASPVEGQIYFDSTNHKLKCYNGTSWETVGMTIEESVTNGYLSVEDQDVKVYELPIASGSALGGVKVGSGLAIDGTGTLSATGGGTADAVEWTNVLNRPTALSAFTNDEGFIDNTVNNLTNYYLKTETYTQTEVNNLIGQIKTIQISVVESLPDTGQSNIIYLVDKASPQTSNVYDEYIWIEDENKFEKIGDTEIDLTDYLTKTGDGSNLQVNGSALGTTITGIENEIDGLATVASTGSYNDLIDTPTLPPTVNKKIETLSTATGTFTATGYIVAVTVLDSVTKEQVMADITYNSFSDDANSSVIVTCAEAPTNPLKVIITSIS